MDASVSPWNWEEEDDDGDEADEDRWYAETDDGMIWKDGLVKQVGCLLLRVAG